MLKKFNCPLALKALSSSFAFFVESKELFFPSSHSIPSPADVIYFSGLGMREEVTAHPRIFPSMAGLQQSMKYAVVIMQT